MDALLKTELKRSTQKWGINFIINWKARHLENPLLWEILLKDALKTKHSLTPKY